MNQNQLLQIGKKILKKENIEEYEIKARLLIEFILKQSREEFIRNSLQGISELQEKKYKEKLEEIIEGKPLQYITHHQEFMGLSFYVDENVLIPQPDTEILVEETLKMISSIQENKLDRVENRQEEKDAVTKLYENKVRVLDLCTGSGAIGISISKYARNVQVTASDISRKALEIAKKNAISNNVDDKIQFVESDLFHEILENQFNIIVSNPPYIETKEISNLSPEVRKEPFIALDGGEDGLKFYKAILKEASNHLKLNGHLLIEIGYNQGEKILTLWENLKSENKCELEIVTKDPIKDLGGNDRVMIFMKK